MNALTFAATAIIIMLPGFIAMFKLFSDQPHTKTQIKLANATTHSINLRVKAAAQAITQGTSRSIILSA